MTLGIKQEIKLLARHSAVYSLGTFMQRIVSLLLLPVYTRFLTPYDYGIKELVGLSSDVIAILLATAISGAFYRFYFNYEDEKNRNEVFSTAVISIGTICLISVCLLSLASSTIASTILDNPDLKHFFYISFSTLWFQTINNLSYSFLKARKKSLSFIGISFSGMFITIGLNIYFVCFLKIGVMGILLSNLLTSFIVAIFFTLPLLIRVGFRFSRFKLVEMLRFGLPLIPSQFGAFIVHLSDRFFIKEYVSIADAGLYALGYRFGTLPGTFISDPFNQVYQPRRLEVYKQKDSENVFGRIFTYFLLLILFVGLCISVMTKDVLMLMAEEKFWSAYKIVPIIVLANIVFSFHYHLNIGIIVHKKTKYLAYINLSNGILVLALNFLFIPKYGIFGAAWITLFAFIYKTAFTYYFSSNFYKVKFELGRIFKIIIVVTAIFLIMQNIEIQMAWVSIIVKIISIPFLYLFGLFTISFFTSEEKIRFLGIIKNVSKKIKVA
ncbi:MAG: oligosaccharide flippase family protein [Syntrophotaleaceae bacterium]